MADPSSADEQLELLELLALCTEAKRLTRARKEASKVHFLTAGPDLWIAAASAYNVVLDLTAKRVQHGCRDFLGQARERRLCKHVAALLLAMDRDVALEVIRGLAVPYGEWHLEVIAARGFKN